MSLLFRVITFYAHHEWFGSAHTVCKLTCLVQPHITVFQILCRIHFTYCPTPPHNQLCVRVCTNLFFVLSRMQVEFKISWSQCDLICWMFTILDIWELSLKFEECPWVCSEVKYPIFNSRVSEFRSWRGEFRSAHKYFFQSCMILFWSGIKRAQFCS